MESDSFSGELYFPAMIFNSTCEAHEEFNAYLLDWLGANSQIGDEDIEKE